MDNGSAIQDALAEITGQRSVPNVFIGGSVSSRLRECRRFGSMDMHACEACVYLQSLDGTPALDCRPLKVEAGGP